MKKIIYIFNILVISITCIYLNFTDNFDYNTKKSSVKFEESIILDSGLNKDDLEEIDFNNIEEILLTSTNKTDEPEINSKSAIVFDRNSKQTLYEKNSDKKVPMASTTKIMTAMIVVEEMDLNKEVVIDKKAAQTGRIETRIKNKR